jgi:hypothetical protein
MTRLLALALFLASLVSPAEAQTKASDPPPFETFKDAHERQRAEDERARRDSRSLLQNDRPGPLGDSRVNAVPAPERYTTQPAPGRK